MKTELINGNVRKVDNSNITVSEWLDIWFDANRVNWGVKTILARKDFVEKKMKPLIGRFKLVDLTLSTYRREFINKLLDRYAPSTVRMHHLIFSIAINAAVEEEIIDRNRFRRLTIKDAEKKDNFLTPTELNLFLEYAERVVNITNYSLFFLLAFTGLRKGEALGLKWKDINFKQKR